MVAFFLWLGGLFVVGGAALLLMGWAGYLGGLMLILGLPILLTGLIARSARKDDEAANQARRQE